VSIGIDNYCRWKKSESLNPKSEGKPKSLCKGGGIGPIHISRAEGCLRVDTLTRPCLRGDSAFQGLTKG